MKLTKYEHACFTVENNDETLIVDPGCFTKELQIPSNVVGIVITHVHDDHFDPAIIESIYDKNPDALLVSLAEITEKIPQHHSIPVIPRQNIKIGQFNLEFFGGKHAEIHSSIPIIDNLGIMINDCIYYPGDSFSEPNKPVDLLALPASGPWFKTSNAIDFLTAVKPKRVFATHNIHNSEPGQALFNRIIGSFAEKVGSEYIDLDVTQVSET
jgi:L-ascorbate metabolism protein UlaG (beta-lactamase superfamily)